MSQPPVTRRRAVSLCVAALTATAGCTTFHPMTERESLAGRRVDVRFARPRSVEARAVNGSRVLLDDVQRVLGQVVEVRADTAFVAVAQWGGSGRWRTERISPVIALRLSDEKMTIGHRRFSAERSAFAIVVTPVAAVLVLLILFATTYTEGT